VLPTLGSPLGDTYFQVKQKVDDIKKRNARATKGEKKVLALHIRGGWLTPPNSSPSSPIGDEFRHFLEDEKEQRR
jgi:hypothetical protein